MKFSNPKTIPRAPKPKTSSQNDLPVKPTSKSDTRKIKSISVAALKKPVLPNPKPVPVKNGKVPLQEEERKIEILPKTGLFTSKPSLKYTSIKTIDPFADTSKSKINSFAYVYNSGGIPCKIDHHAVHNKLKWDQGVNVAELNYDPILVTCFEGLMEQKHPYNFIVPAVIKDMLMNEEAEYKVKAIVGKLVWPLRTGLLSDNPEVFENSLMALKYLSTVVKDDLNTYLKNLLSPIIKKIDKKNFRDKCFDVLRTLEQNGGPEVGKIIKTTIPTYTSG